MTANMQNRPNHPTKPNSVCAAGYFPRFTHESWHEDFLSFVEDITRRCGIPLDKFQCWYEQPKGTQFRTIRYTKSGLAKFKELTDHKNIRGVDFGALPEGGYQVNCRFQLTAAKEIGSIWRLYMEMPPDLFRRLSKGTWEDVCREILGWFSLYGEMKYFFLHPIEYVKNPYFFINGWAAPIDFSPEEHEDSAAWWQNRHLFDSQVRNLYLANYLTPKHLEILKPRLDDIRGIVGVDNVIMTGEESLLLFLPFDLYTYQDNESEIEAMRGRLRDIFKAAGVLMQSRPFDREAWLREMGDRATVVTEEAAGEKQKYPCPDYVKKIFKPATNELTKVLTDRFPSVETGMVATKAAKEGCEVLIDQDCSMVKAKVGKRTLMLYDPSRHPAHNSFEMDLDFEPTVYACDCGGTKFDVAVGYEYPDDSEDRNDISWFALAGKCLTCGTMMVIFDDETA